MFLLDILVPVEHYGHPKQEPPALVVRPVYQSAPGKGGEAYAVSVGPGGLLVIQRAKVGSAILAADGKPRIELLDTVVVRLDKLARYIMDEARAARDEVDAEAKSKPAGGALKLV